MKNELLDILLSIICFPILVVMVLIYVFIPTEEDERLKELDKKELNIK